MAFFTGGLNRVAFFCLVVPVIHPSISLSLIFRERRAGDRLQSLPSVRPSLLAAQIRPGEEEGRAAGDGARDQLAVCPFLSLSLSSPPLGSHLPDTVDAAHSMIPNIFRQELALLCLRA